MISLYDNYNSKIIRNLHLVISTLKFFSRDLLIESLKKLGLYSNANNTFIEKMINWLKEYGYLEEKYSVAGFKILGITHDREVIFEILQSARYLEHIEIHGGRYDGWRLNDYDKYVAELLINLSDQNTYHKLAELSHCISQNQLCHTLSKFQEEGFIEAYKSDSSVLVYLKPESRDVFYKKYIAPQVPSSRYYIQAQRIIENLEDSSYPIKASYFSSHVAVQFLLAGWSAEGGRQLTSEAVQNEFSKLLNRLNKIRTGLGLRKIFLR